MDPDHLSASARQELKTAMMQKLYPGLEKSPQILQVVDDRSSFRLIIGLSAKLITDYCSSIRCPDYQSLADHFFIGQLLLDQPIGLLAIRLLDQPIK